MQNQMWWDASTLNPSIKWDIQDMCHGSYLLCIESYSWRCISPIFIFYVSIPAVLIVQVWIAGMEWIKKWYCGRFRGVCKLPQKANWQEQTKSNQITFSRVHVTDCKTWQSLPCSVAMAWLQAASLSHPNGSTRTATGLAPLWAAQAIASTQNRWEAANTILIKK